MDQQHTLEEPADLKLQHWRLEIDRDNIFWLYCDRADSSTNTLGEAVLFELDLLLDHAHSANPRGLVILSGKAGGFIAGADIREFDEFTSAEAVSEKIREGHALFNKLEALPCPTAVGIKGFCQGGGLELSLCCDYRIAQDTDDTRIGLPEVKLGIYPGLGGSVRLPERIGGLKSLELMLTGRSLRARAALAYGVVDEVISTHQELYWAARRAVLQRRKSLGPGLLGALSNSLPARLILAPVLRRKTAKQANPDHYPAPFALIKAWQKYGGRRKRMFRAEAANVGELMVGETATNLRRVFFMTERLKGLGKQSRFPVRRVHVVGSGVMGGDIAAVCAARGMEVTLQDQAMHSIEAAIERANAYFKKVLKNPHRAQAAGARLIADPEGVGVARADVVIEAIFEDLGAKSALFKDLEPRLKPGAVLATNTSAIALEHICIGLNKPERLIGLHFFNPATKMPLVEVVKSICGDPEEISKGCAFAAQLGKFPLPVKSSPGFLVNRVLAPYMMTALSVYLQGTPKEAIDLAAVKFGMPMGPVELADTVGLDICIKVAETLEDDSLKRQLEMLDMLVSAGKLGKKSGEGLYTWQKGKPVRDREATKGVEDTELLARRLLQPLLQECRDCMADEIVEDAELLDAGIIFGTGFAPFRGGPMRYLEAQNP